MLVIYNPISPKFDSKQDLNIYKKYKPDFFATTGVNDKSKIKKIFNKKSYDVVVVIGGDGTVNLVASHLVDTNCKLVIVPRGSTNGLFYDLSSDELPLSKRKIKSIDVIKIGEDYCFHLAGFGLNAHIIKESKKGNVEGLFKYLIAFFKSFLKFRKYVFKVNGKLLKKRLLVIANGKSHGSKLEINPNGKIDDGKFEICTIKSQQSFKKIKIVNYNKSPFHIDGEFKGQPEQIVASIKNKSLKLLI